MLSNHSSDNWGMASRRKPLHQMEGLTRFEREQLLLEVVQIERLRRLLDVEQIERLQRLLEGVQIERTKPSVPHRGCWAPISGSRAVSCPTLQDSLHEQLDARHFKPLLNHCNSLERQIMRKGMGPQKVQAYLDPLGRTSKLDSRDSSFNRLAKDKRLLKMVCTGQEAMKEYHRGPRYLQSCV